MKLRSDRSLYERLRANGPIAAQKFDRNALAMLMLELLEETAARNDGSCIGDHKIGSIRSK